MDSTDETLIELSRKKIVLLILGACVFVALGGWLLSLDGAAVRSERSFRGFFNEVWVVRGLGLTAILFFGLCGLYALRALFDKKPGLVLNSSGLVDNASAVSAGFIPWSEVVGASVYEIQGQKMLVIDVRTPQTYIDRGGALRRLLNKANYRMVGSPIALSSKVLKIDFPRLVFLFNRYMYRYGVAPDDDAGQLSTPDGLDALPAYSPHEGFEPLDERFEPRAEPGGQPLNWSPIAVRGTVGSGGVGILVLLASSLDYLFQIKVPFWAVALVSMWPTLAFFVAVPDFLPLRFVRPVQRLAAVWYLVFAAVSISLAASRRLEGVELFLMGFILLGAWPCLVALRGLRAAGED